MSRATSKQARRVAGHRGLASVLLLVLGVAAAVPAHALFEDLALSPRARALGEATVATMNDPWAYYYNPAMLTLVGFPQVGASTARPNGLDFNRLTSVAVAAPLSGKRGTLAVAWRRYAVTFKDVDLESENTLSISHGFRLFQDATAAAAFGWTLNLYHADFASSIGQAGDGSNGIDPGSAWTVGVDIGALVSVYERTRAGISVHNLNSPIIGDEGEELIRRIDVGVAYEPYLGVTTAFDVLTELNQDIRFRGGIEFEIVPQLDLRAGLETNPNKVCGGFGVHLPYLTLDYGFSTGGGVLDTSHHFGLAVQWDRTKSEGSP